MAAIGGDTTVPTNWTGLIGVAVLIAVVAAATYIGLTTMDNGDEGPAAKDELSVQEVFSSSARREIAAAEPVRALSRTDFAVASPNADQSSDTSDTDDTSADWDVADEEWNEPAESAVTDSSDDPASAEADTAEYAEPEMAAAESDMDEEAMAEDTQAALQDYQEAQASDWQDRSDTEPSPSTTASTTRRPAAEALVAWWKDAGSGLGVRFAGALDRGDNAGGIAVMFTETVSAQQAADYLSLTDAAGNPVTGSWQTGANPTLLLQEGLAEGRYVLKIKSGLPASSGKTLQNTVSGPIYVY